MTNLRTLTGKNRNLILTGLVTAGIVIGIQYWFRHKQMRRESVAMQFALARLHGDAPAATLDGTHPCLRTKLSDGIEDSVLTRCATLTSDQGAVDQFEVDLRYGAFKVQQTDLEVKDIFDVPLTRTYNAQDWIGGDRVTEFGRNTNYHYDIAPLGTTNPYTEMDLILEDGDFFHFKRISPGTGYADAVYQHSESSTKFYKSTIYWNGNGWTLQLTNGETMVFPESYKAERLSQGAATEIGDAAGNKLQLERTSDRNLKKIQTPHGRWIQFTNDPQSRIVRAEDDSGNWTSYTYNGQGMLSDVTNASGRVRHYSYSDSEMTAIQDANGHFLVQNIYSGNVLMAQVLSNGDAYRYQYEWSANKRYAVKVTITTPDGSKLVVEPGDSVPERLR